MMCCVGSWGVIGMPREPLPEKSKPWRNLHSRDDFWELRDREIAELIPHGPGGWPEIIFKDGSVLEISCRDEDFDWTLYPEGRRNDGT